MGDIRENCHQLLAEYGGVRMILQSFAGTLALDFVGMFQNIFERTVLLKQLYRRLFPDSPHSRNVIRRISHQSQDVYELVRLEAELLLETDIGDRIEFLSTISRTIKADIPAQKLLKILVGRDYHDVGFFALRFPCQSTYDVVRFHTLHLNHRDIHGPDDLLYAWQVGEKIFRRRISMCLVFGIHLVSERTAFAVSVKYNGHVLDSVVFYQFHQGRCESICR